MSNRYDRCPNCMKTIDSQDDRCPSCGFDIAGYEEKSTCLKPFTVLQNKYMIGRVIGVGGFGITYIGWDLNLQTYIAIKEYFPDSIATRDTVSGNTQVTPNESKIDIYNKGLKRYVEEAQNLSKFYQLQGIVSVKDFFYENGTGYIVMEYINGINLKQFLNNSGGMLDENTVLTLMKPVLESMYQIHNSGLVHRDISPDNIMVDSDGKIKLIDFGSARGNSAETDKTYTVILKHGYAPSEQYYAKGNQGPWTDIYSICATMYKMLTGKVPPNSIERMENDEYVAPSAWGVTVSPNTEAVIAKGLAVKVADRYQNIGDLLKDLYGSAPNIAAGGSVVNSTTFNPIASTSLSQQSMHLSNVPVTENKYVEEKKKVKLPVIIGAAVAAIVFIALIVFLLTRTPKKDKDKETTATTTENQHVNTPSNASQTDPDSVDPTTEQQPVQPGVYQWPTELSDDWKDYMIQLDGTIYQFPIPYTEWMSKGWRADTAPTYVSAGDIATIYYHNDNMEVEVSVANYSIYEEPIENCYVIGIEIDPDYNDVSANAEIIIAANIKLYESTDEDVKAAYGTPDDKSEGSDTKYYDYFDNGNDDALELEFTSDNKLYSIAMVNAVIPAECENAAQMVPQEAPSINSNYTAPAGPSTDRFDRIITVDSVNYKLPCPVSVFVENGWEIDKDVDAVLWSGLFNNSVVTYLEKDGSRIHVYVENKTNNAILTTNGIVTQIEIDEGECTIPVVFPGGIVYGDNASAFEAAYGDLEADGDYSVTDYSSFKAYHVYHYENGQSVSVSMYADPETLVITDYEYDISGFEMD